MGYVTEFEIPTEYFDTFKIHAVGGRACEELWVFSENLEKFNSMIIGEIKVVASYFGKDYQAAV